MKKSKKEYLVSTIITFVFGLLLVITCHAQGTYFVGEIVKPSGTFAKTFTLFIYKGKTFVLGKYIIDIIALFVLPLLFNGLLRGTELLTNVLKSKKKKEAEAYEESYDKYINSCTKVLNKTNSFNPEDYRHFRENTKFQEVLKKLFEIYTSGETETNNFETIKRKFNKGSKEKEALSYLIPFTKALIEKGGQK